MKATAMEVCEPSARYLTKSEHALLSGFELLATAPSAVARLRELIIEFAIRGGLTTQNLNDEPAVSLIAKAQAQRGTPATKQKLSAIRSERTAPYALPTGWCWSSLGEIGQISPRNEVSDDTAASFVQMSSIPVATTESHATETRQWRDIKSGFTHFAEGDVGLAKITPCFENGKSTVFRGLTNGIGAGTTELHVVRPLGGVLPEYILAFLKSPGFLRNGEVVMTGSAGQKRLPRAYFEGTPLPLPPLAEQHRIVARIEELMGLCDALEQSGRLADEQHGRLTSTLFDALATSASPHELAENWKRVAEHFDLLIDRPESIECLEQTILQLAVRGLLVHQDAADESARDLLERITAYRLDLQGSKAKSEPISVDEAARPFPLPIGWVWAPWEAVALQIGDIDHKMPREVAAGVPYISPRDFIEGNGINFAGAKKITETDYEDLASKIRPERGDLIYPRYGTIGKVRLVETDLRFLASYSCAIIKCLKGFVDPRYQYIVSVSALIVDQATAATNKTTQPNVGLKSIKSFLFPLPPLAEQQRIVASVEELRRLCVDLRQRLIQARETQSRLADALVAEVA